MAANLLTVDGGVSRRDPIGLAVWSIVAAFGTYFCMYAFRRPFAVGQFADISFGGLGLKSLYVSAQMMGYALSKVIGIKIISELAPRWRAMGILVLIGAAELTLVLFGLLPPPLNAVMLFLNGLPLGMVFGLVLGFLEGRQATESLTAGLCASFILADGVMKDVGAWLLRQGISEFWMPATAGLLFLPPLVLFVWMLTRIPPPNAADVAERSLRTPLTRADRWRFFAAHAPVLVMLLTLYLLITNLRSMRADFTPELWRGMGQQVQQGIFARSELCVALGVLLVNGSCSLIRDNRRALLMSLATSLGGLALIVAGLILFPAGLLSGFAFMVLLGLGLYLPYVAMHTTILERLIALTRDRGNLGFLMYVADAVGYVGYVGVLLLRPIISNSGSVLEFFVAACWLVVGVSAVCLLLCIKWLMTSSSKEPVHLAAEESALKVREQQP